MKCHQNSGSQLVRALQNWNRNYLCTPNTSDVIPENYQSKDAIRYQRVVRQYCGFDDCIIGRKLEGPVVPFSIVVTEITRSVGGRFKNFENLVVRNKILNYLRKF